MPRPRRGRSCGPCSTPSAPSERISFVGRGAAVVEWTDGADPPAPRGGADRATPPAAVGGDRRTSHVGGNPRIAQPPPAVDAVGGGGTGPGRRAPRDDHPLPDPPGGRHR